MRASDNSRTLWESPCSSSFLSLVSVSSQSQWGRLLYSAGGSGSDTSMVLRTESTQFSQQTCHYVPSSVSLEFPPRHTRTLRKTGSRQRAHVKLSDDPDEGLWFSRKTLSKAFAVYLQGFWFRFYSNWGLFFLSYSFPQKRSALFNPAFLFNIYNCACKTLHRHAAVVGTGFSPGPPAFPPPQNAQTHTLGWLAAINGTVRGLSDCLSLCVMNLFRVRPHLHPNTAGTGSSTLRLPVSRYTVTGSECMLYLQHQNCSHS